MVKPVRIGKYGKEKPRPLKTFFRSDQDGCTFIDNFSICTIKDTDVAVSKVAVSRDRTTKEILYLNNLRTELEAGTEAG